MTSHLEARYHRQRVPLLWWLGRRTYLAFTLRELSSVFVAWFIVELLLLIRAVASGPADYQRFLDLLGNPAMVVLNVVTLAFLLYHTITFLNLTPQAVVVKVRGRRVPKRALLAGMYLTWAVVSVVLAWLMVS